MSNVFNSKQIASIKVIGVGGAGNNAINRMIDAGVDGVEFIAMNTDAQVVNASKAKHKLILGKQISKGLGAGANPEIGKEAALESLSEIKEYLKDADMVFVAAGMGGGTGTGASPIIAKAAQDMDILTIGIVTKPFTFEGRMRNIYAMQGIDYLQKNVDAMITISNDRLLEVIGGAPLKTAFREADNILRQGVQTITDLIAIPALINLDFADIRTVLKDKGSALFGIGIGKGENKAIEAANKAITSPLLEASFKGAKNVIVNITGGDTMTLYDANDAVDIIRQAAGGEVNIIFGVAINEHIQDGMIVNVIATGFDNAEFGPKFSQSNKSNETKKSFFFGKKNSDDSSNENNNNVNKTESNENIIAKKNESSNFTQVKKWTNDDFRNNKPSNFMNRSKNNYNDNWNNRDDDK